MQKKLERLAKRYPGLTIRSFPVGGATVFELQSPDKSKLSTFRVEGNPSDVDGSWWFLNDRLEDAAKTLMQYDGQTTN